MKKLKIYLLINSAFSGISGLAMVLFSDFVNQIFKISNPYVIPVIGVNLLVFSLFVWYVSYRHLDKSFLIKMISFLDALWVAGSFIIIAMGLFDLSATGYILIAVVAVWVGFLGYVQFKYNKIVND